MKRFQIAQAGYIVISIAFYAGAVLFLCSQWLPASALSVFCGVCLLAYGVIKIIGYFSEDLFCLAFRYDLAFGLLLLVTGILALALHDRAERWLALGVGWLALLDSVLKIQMSQEAKKFGLARWNIIAATAAVTGCLAVLHIIHCSVSSGSPNILAALTLLSVGVMNHCVAAFAVKEPKPSYEKTERKKEI